MKNGTDANSNLGGAKDYQDAKQWLKDNPLPNPTPLPVNDEELAERLFGPDQPPLPVKPSEQLDLLAVEAQAMVITPKQFRDKLSTLLAQEYSRGRRDFIEEMLLDEMGNDAAGHKWSRSDFMKYLEDARSFLEEEKGQEDVPQ